MSSPFTHFGCDHIFEFQRGGEDQAIEKFKNWLKYIGSQAPGRITSVRVHATLAISRLAVQPTPESNPVINEPPAPVVKVVKEVFDADDPNI